MRLPVQLQRAMAAEAEAAREARAKVINTAMTRKMDYVFIFIINVMLTLFTIIIIFDSR